MLIRAIRSAALILCLLLSAPLAHGFSSQPATCFSPSSSGGGFVHGGVASPGAGGFTITATVDGSPVSEVQLGDTVQISLSRTTGSYKGFLVRANLGSTGGTAVGGFSISSADHQLVSSCSPTDAGVGHTTVRAMVPSPGPDLFDWTAPLSLAPGDQVVISAHPVVGMVEYYGDSGEIAVTLTVAAPPSVPAMGMAAWIVFASLLVATSTYHLRST